MKISMIAAMAANRVIGKDNDMPWHLPADLKHFKSVTMGKPIIMGRKTYQSIGRALPGRRNIVLTRDPQFNVPDADVVAGPQQAMALVADCDEVMVIGGGMVYQQFLPYADYLYLTFIQAEIEGDTQFPDYTQAANWQEASRIIYPMDENNPCDLHFVTLKRQP